MLRTGTVLVPHEAVWWDGSDEGWAAVVDALPWDQCSVISTVPGRVWVYGHEQHVRPGWLLADPVIRRADAEDGEKVIADGQYYIPTWERVRRVDGARGEKVIADE